MVNNAMSGTASARLRSTTAPSNMKEEAFSQHGHHGASTGLRSHDMESAAQRFSTSSSMGMTKVGKRALGGLVILGLFLLLSNVANRFDNNLSPSYILSYPTAITSMDKVYAKCARAGMHPITCKVEHAAELASQLRSRQSTTPQQAVRAYKRRYLRPPPPGFEKWVALALEHNAAIIDDFDQIEIDINTFRQAGLMGDKLKNRIREAKALAPGYDFGHLSIVGGEAVSFGPDVGPLSATTLNEILRPVQHIIPDVTVPFNWYAEPRMPYPSSVSSKESVRTQSMGHRDPTAILQRACPSYQISSKRPWNALEPPLDYCQEDIEELRELHGFLQAPDTFNPFNKLVPMLSRSKLSNFADILAPNVCYASPDYRGGPDTIAWKRKLNSVYWRGTTTGEFQTPTTWARGHRHRMLRYVKQLREAANKLMTGVEVDPLDAIYAANRTIAPSRESVNVAGNSLPLFDYTDQSVVEALKRLGPSTFNVSWSKFVLADDPTLASLMANQVTTGTEGRDVMYKHKFLLDLDGQSMSCRFYQLLSSNSLVFKQTIWSEYHDDRLVPWIHYVPLDLRVQNNELPMLLDFFINDPEGSEAAAKIASASKEWAEATLRPIDVSLYYARLLLEFAALFHQPS